MKMPNETLTPEQCAKLAETMGWDQFTKYLPDPFCYFGGANHRTQMISNCKLTPAGAWLVGTKFNCLPLRLSPDKWEAEVGDPHMINGEVRHPVVWHENPEMAVALAALEVIGEL